MSISDLVENLLKSSSKENLISITEKLTVLNNPTSKAPKSFEGELKSLLASSEYENLGNCNHGNINSNSNFHSHQHSSSVPLNSASLSKLIELARKFQRDRNKNLSKKAEILQLLRLISDSRKSSAFTFPASDFSNLQNSNNTTNNTLTVQDLNRQRSSQSNYSGFSMITPSTASRSSSSRQTPRDLLNANSVNSEISKSSASNQNAIPIMNSHFTSLGAGTGTGASSSIVGAGPAGDSNINKYLTSREGNNNATVHSSLHGQSGIRFRSTPILGQSNNQRTNQSSSHNNQAHLHAHRDHQRKIQNHNQMNHNQNERKYQKAAPNPAVPPDALNFQKNSSLPYLSEAQLYNQVLFVMRGVEQTHIKRNKNEDAYRIAPTANVNPRHIGVLYKLCEMGWLHDKIHSYQTSAQQSRARYGKTGQALGYRIHSELKEYYVCLSHLSDYEQVKSLVQLLCGTAVVRSRLRYLAVIVENCGIKRGSTLLSTLSEFMHLGDPLIRQLAKELFNSAVQPFLQIIQVWLNEGDLTDDYCEFFISEGTSLDANRAEKFWNEAFEIKSEHIPSFFDEKMCRKILNTGKSVNFLRTICKDKEFLATRTNKRDYLGNYKYDMNEIIPDLVHKSYFRASSALLKCLREKFDLNLHLIMMRNYLLLGQGDFIRHLLDQLKDELDKRAPQVYGHNLKDIVDSALRISSCHPETTKHLDRLTVKLLEHHPGETGWDIFCLDYVIEESSPLKAIFSPSIVRSYLRLFQFLWRAKRMEHVVAISWTDLTFQAKHAVKNLPEAVGLLHKCQLVLQEQMHYLSQIQYYVTFEVLECGWADFQNSLVEVGDFDQLLRAHESFLDKLLGSCLLKPTSQNIAGKIRSTFDSVETFQTLLNTLNTHCEEEIRRRDSVSKKTGWTLNEEEQIQRQTFNNFVRTKLTPKVDIRKTAWNNLVTDMLSSLLSEGDEYLRSLAWRLDFSSHYYKV